jgi:N12 class adenine-specific DNA methylase
MRTMKQKIECIRKAILNSQGHIQAGDPKRVYSQYIRYALDEVSDINFCRSVAANDLKRNDVIHEHVVPHSIVMNKLISLENLTHENIESVIKKFYVICAITKEEDKKLNTVGLRSKMPKYWNDKSDSIFARYELAGIKIVNDKNENS